MGLLCNNVLHDRSAFTDDPTHPPRLLYRARYLDRIRNTCGFESLCSQANVEFVIVDEQNDPHVRHAIQNLVHETCKASGQELKVAREQRADPLGDGKGVEAIAWPALLRMGGGANGRSKLNDGARLAHAGRVTAWGLAA